MRVVYLFFALTCLGCSTGIEAETETAELDGKKLTKEKCYSCHNTQGTGNMLAPPMSRVRDHYIDDNTSRSEFVQAIVNWVGNPIDSLSRMPGAKRKFGLMPKQEVDAKELQAIAEYLYDTDSDLPGCSH